MATILSTLLVDQASRNEAATVILIVPADQVGDLGHDDRVVIISYKRTGRNIRSLWRLTMAMTRTMYTVRPTVIHLHSTFAGIIGRIVAFPLKIAHGIRVVYCAHGFPFLMEVGPLQRWTYGLVERLLSYLSDVVICISEYEYAAAVRIGLRRRVLRLVYNGVKDPRDAKLLPDESMISYTTDEAMLCPQQRYDNKSIALMFIGRLDRQKGFDILLDAFRRLPDWFTLTVVGEAVESGYRPPADDSRITFVGWVEHAKVWAYLRRADVLVVPSRWEGFGLAAVEAMKSGVPVVASTCGALPEIVADGVTGRLFKTGDSDALYRILLETDPETWTALGQCAADTMRERFTNCDMVNATWQLYGV